MSSLKPTPTSAAAGVSLFVLMLFGVHYEEVPEIALDYIDDLGDLYEDLTTSELDGIRDDMKPLAEAALKSAESAGIGVGGVSFERDGYQGKQEIVVESRGCDADVADDILDGVRSEMRAADVEIFVCSASRNRRYISRL